MLCNNFKKILLTSYILLIIFPLNVFAYSKSVIPGGYNIGINIKNKGIIVTGFYKINNKFIETDLKKGDIIIKINSTNIDTIDDFKNATYKNEIIKITYIRNNKEYNTVLKLFNDNNQLKTGLYVRDTVSGIGTLTYIDPKTKIYGALGHEIIETNSGYVLKPYKGTIYNSSVTSIKKSIKGLPGYKNASININNTYGNISENTNRGIFGIYNKIINKNDNLMEVGEYGDINIGSAKIRTVIDKENVKDYSIKILDVNNNYNDNKNILFEITDDILISKTGGIVEGMSGSPIIQNNKIIGAVNNVLVNNPKRGFGILITSMLKEGEN